MNKSQNIAKIYDRHGVLSRRSSFEKKKKDEIVKAVIDSDIPLYQNPELLNMLTRIDNIKNVPEEYYPAVAETLAFIYKLEREMKMKMKQN